ncbi:MAG TPA: aminoglycoside phosphotransferase family protein, partial [Jatrophihabitantaceae bacterium]|nr:aminoglycoside phosphotransferase family protein [Jatrophihabitantaceae bacterium]
MSLAAFVSRDEPEIAAALAHFAARDVPQRSIYRWSPVFPATVVGQPVVIKRARQSRPEAIADWTRDLAAEGLRCVVPLPLDVENPVRLASGSAWVAYPWIHGRPYRPDHDDIVVAGDFLGRIHARPLRGDGPPAFKWPQYQPDEVATDLSSYLAVAKEHLPALDRVTARLHELGTRFEAELLPAIRDADLPVRDVTSDWKASNLIYTSSGAVLIDPDNAERGPRLLDLASTALQFHSETTTHRAFATDEWEWFRDGYLDHVELTATERT